MSSRKWGSQRLRRVVLICLELLSCDDQVGRLVALDEDLDVRLRVDHLRGVVNGLALVAHGLTHFANDRRELLEVVLEKIKLRVIVLLDAIESIAVLGANLVNMLIH